MSPPPARVYLCLCAALCFTPTASPRADEKAGPEFSGEFGVGAEYDSNVAIDEVDVNSAESDYAATLEAELAMKQALGESASLSLSYNINQSLYSEFSEVDRQTHLVGSDLSVDVGRLDAGITGFYINSRLDGNEFLESYRASPYLSGFVGKKWYARAAYVYADKTLTNNPGRDAVTDAAEGDLYYFRQGLRSYFNLGIRLRDEDATADRFDYRSWGIKLRYVQRFKLFSRLAKGELGWRYEDRDFTSITPSIGEQRRDQRMRWQAELEVPLSEHFTWRMYYSYSDYDSNLPRVDYVRNLAGTQLLYAW